MFATRTAQVSCFGSSAAGEREQYGHQEQQRHEQQLERNEAERLREGAAGEQYVIGGRKDVPGQRAESLERRDGGDDPENCEAGRNVRIAVPKMAAIWVRTNVEISSP